MIHELVVLAVLEMNVEGLLEKSGSAYAPALTQLLDDVQRCARLVEAIDRGELSACNECGCTVEDGECVCPRPCHEGCRLCAEGEM